MSCAGGDEEARLSAAQRARIERNRVRAQALRSARVHLPEERPTATPTLHDSGGGFLLEEASAPPRLAPPPPAPLPLALQPACLRCERRIATSYMLETYEHPVCDDCRPEEELMTRTEAKEEFLLKDCDLDLRSPALRSVSRRNPHRGSYAAMRLYVRAQVRERALLVWGSEAALQEERARRDQRRGERHHKQASRRLRALRMDVRGSLYARAHAAHEHAWGEESARGDDAFARVCTTCGHEEVYEKM